MTLLFMIPKMTAVTKNPWMKITKKSMMEGNKNAGKAETYPADYSKKLADSLLEKQDISQVDTVAGATNSSKNFKAMVEALKSNMSKGKTDTVLVDAPTE